MSPGHCASARLACRSVRGWMWSCRCSQQPDQAADDPLPELGEDSSLGASDNRDAEIEGTDPFRNTLAMHAPGLDRATPTSRHMLDQCYPRARLRVGHLQSEEYANPTGDKG